jgi:hypothetical protein
MPEGSEECLKLREREITQAAGETIDTDTGTMF